MINVRQGVFHLRNEEASYLFRVKDGFLEHLHFGARAETADAPAFAARPGRGWGVFETKIGPVGVMNLLGRCNLDFRPDNPFLIADKILQELGEVPVFLDFHAEATSEKLALAYQLDGKIAAQWGTHTHVQTADEQILPNGTGYLTDLGMTGPVRSVIGVRPEQSIANFRGELTSRYEVAPGPCMLTGAVFTYDAAAKRCTGAERVRILD